MGSWRRDWAVNWQAWYKRLAVERIWPLPKQYIYEIIYLCELHQHVGHNQGGWLGLLSNFLHKEDLLWWPTTKHFHKNHGVRSCTRHLKSFQWGGFLLHYQDRKPKSLRLHLCPNRIPQWGAWHVTSGHPWGWLNPSQWHQVSLRGGARLERRYGCACWVIWPCTPSWMQWWLSPWR